MNLLFKDFNLFKEENVHHFCMFCLTPASQFHTYLYLLPWMQKLLIWIRDTCHYTCIKNAAHDVCSYTATDHHFGTLAIFDIRSQITTLRLIRVMTVVDFHSQKGKIQQIFGIQMNSLKGFFVI